MKFNKYKHKKSKWVTFGIIKSIQYRDNLYKKQQLRPTDDMSAQFATNTTNLKNLHSTCKFFYYETIFAK